MSPHHQPAPTLDLSVVVPVYNERDNVLPLADDIVRAVAPLGRSFEVILVNDGSTDGSAAVLDEAAAKHPEVKVLHFAGNRGQTIAIAAGMYYASGRVIVLLDGDRQNDPADIGRLLDKLDEGYDCVSGWRKDRQDSGLRKLPSMVANRLFNRVCRLPIHDLGCTLKAYRRGIVDPEELFGEMHRFLAAYAAAHGARIAELVVRHHPRRAGVSKYGLSRTCRVLADILLVRILLKYRTRPSHMFAKLAQYLGLGAAAVGLWGLLDVIRYRSLAAATLPLLAALLMFLTAVIVVSVGLVGELVVRSRYALSGQHPWTLARTVNLDDR